MSWPLNELVKLTMLWTTGPDVLKLFTTRITDNCCSGTVLLLKNPLHVVLWPISYPKTSPYSFETEVLSQSIFYQSVCSTSHKLSSCPAGTWRWNDVLLTSMRRHHIASTSRRRHLTPCACWMLFWNCSSTYVLRYVVLK